MKSVIPLYLLVLLIAPIVNKPADARAEKSYHVDSLVIEATAQVDGSLTVVEERTYRFRGRFKFAYRTFSRAGGIDYSDFAVSENGEWYAWDDSKSPGTYMISENKNEIEVRWFYEARNETRTFTIAYQVENLIHRHPDAAVLHYQFLGSDFAKPSSNVRLSVTPPDVLDSTEVRQWLHGPLWAESKTRPDGVITAWCEHLPARQFLELRVLYPPDAFPDAPAASDLIVSPVMAEEADMAETANRRRIQARNKAELRVERLKLGGIVMPVFALTGLLAWVAVFLRYGRRPQVPSGPKRSPEVPSDLPPALVGFLVADRTVNGNTLMATLLDLASRGFLEFHEDSEVRDYPLGLSKKVDNHYWILRRTNYQKHRSELLPYETMLIDFVFDELADGERAAMDLFKKNKSKSRKFFEKWKKTVKTEGQGRGYYSPSGFTGRNIGMMVGGFLIVLAIPLGVIFFEWAILPGILGVLLMLISLAMVHHTPEGAIEAARWKSLKKYLKYERSQHARFLDSVERYLVYGVGLGIGKKALTNLGDKIPGDRHHGYVTWYYLHGSQDGTSGPSFGAAFSASVAAASSSMSSASGAGGGASGGGGGAGGGGGGAG